jgi:DNA-binding NtrC family response regulator
MPTSTSVLLVDDDEAFRHVLARELSRLGFAVSTAGTGAEGLRAALETSPDIVLLDLQLPDTSGLAVLEGIRDAGVATQVVMMTGHGSIDTAIESIRKGAFDYVVKPCPLEELEVRIARAIERQSLQRRATLLERGLTPADPTTAFIGASAAFRGVMQLVDRVAPTGSTVLITGETGSGKERAAKLIHARSPRRHKPFVVVECAALQESLLQSELFGHERGAFTGADRAKPGLFEVAHGGTIFLDEIGEVSPATQVKLLRVLDTSTFRRVGATSEIRVDVRILAATNRDLQAMVRQGLFREDLYYRLSTVTLTMPPLREREGDIDVLAAHFVARLNDRFGVRKRLGAEALEALRRHDWPGNVRELLHVVEASMIVSDDVEIAPAHLPASLRAQPGAAHTSRVATGSPAGLGKPAGEGGAAPAPLTLDELERAHIEAALRATAGHRAQTARMLGISERNLYRKLRDYGIE